MTAPSLDPSSSLAEAGVVRRATSRDILVVDDTAANLIAMEAALAADSLFKPVHPEVLRGKVSVFVELFDAHARERARVLDDQRRVLESAALRREAERQRAAADELAQPNTALALADQRKDELLAILAHELRNPLAPILAVLELVRRIVKLDDVIDESVIACRPQLELRRHTLVSRPPAGSPIVVGDVVRLTQIVANLLNNAVRCTNPGGRIVLEWGEQGSQAFVRVTDNGRGIPAALLDRVFDMFVQERVGSDGSDGLGLGLALVQRLLTMHDGTVSVVSAGPDQGSSFEIRLPQADAAALAELAGPTAPELKPARPQRAVVVEDNEDLRELVSELLSALGLQVTSAGDGLAGLDLIRAERPDVALIDIGLPGLDGYGVARAVRHELSDLSIRLIAMTGYGQESDRARALDAGFDVHITKPATAATILRALAP